MTSKTIIHVYHKQNDRVDSLVADISGSDRGACDICDTQEMTGANGRIHPHCFSSKTHRTWGLFTRYKLQSLISECSLPRNLLTSERLILPRQVICLFRAWVIAEMNNSCKWATRNFEVFTSTLLCVIWNSCFAAALTVVHQKPGKALSYSVLEFRT